MGNMDWVLDACPPGLWRGPTGRPLGSEGLMIWLEGLLGRRLRPRKRGPKPRNVPS